MFPALGTCGHSHPLRLKDDEESRGEDDDDQR
jgi:hypothetical protein